MSRRTTPASPQQCVQAESRVRKMARTRGLSLPAAGFAGATASRQRIDTHVAGCPDGNRNILMSTNLNRLFLPALRARMGDWIYYIALMSMKEAASRVSVAADIHTSTPLKDLLQRTLTSNSNRITEHSLRFQLFLDELRKINSNWSVACNRSGVIPSTAFVPHHCLHGAGETAAEKLT